MKEQLSDIYNEICRELTIFENSDIEEDEITYEDWATIFYHLLVKTQNTIDMLEE